MNPERPRPTTEQVSKVFRNLADRHAEERSRVSVERSWNRLQSKVLARSGLQLGGRLRLLAHPAQHLLARAAQGLRTFSPALVAAACLLAVGIGLGASGWVNWGVGSHQPTRANLTYDVKPLGAGHGQQVLQPDGWLRTGSDGAELSFSDGSRIEMSGQSALRLKVTGEHAAEAELSSGQVRAAILHADTTRWQLHAGPYRVDVVGTEFDLAYGSSGFSLAMHTGRVQVTGPAGRTWTLDAGQNLHLPAEGALVSAPVVTAPQVDAPLVDAEVEHRTTAGVALGGAVANGAKAHNLAAPRSWPELVAKGQFQRVIDEAKALGSQFPGPRANEAQITAVAQAAGYSGEARFAERCWRYLRQHHARSAGSAKAAFYLARIAEQRGDLKEALDWLGVYNKEAPGGAFSAEALGRQLLILRRLDPSAPRAVDAAKEYLRRFPQGAHREAAQATLGVTRGGR